MSKDLHGIDMERDEDNLRRCYLISRSSFAAT